MKICPVFRRIFKKISIQLDAVVLLCKHLRKSYLRVLPVNVRFRFNTGLFEVEKNIFSIYYLNEHSSGGVDSVQLPLDSIKVWVMQFQFYCNILLQQVANMCFLLAA
jgi:hypothetical protein